MDAAREALAPLREYVRALRPHGVSYAEAWVIGRLQSDCKRLYDDLQAIDLALGEMAMAEQLRNKDASGP